MLNSKELSAWVLSLQIDKQYGIGVDGIYSERKGDIPTDINNTCIDDILNDLDLMLIARTIGEAVWVIDYKLWTRESIIKNVGEHFNNIKEIVDYYEIEPYTPKDLEGICKLYPIGVEVKDDDYYLKESDWYKRLRQNFDTPLTEQEQEELDKMIATFFPKKECKLVNILS